MIAIDRGTSIIRNIPVTGEDPPAGASYYYRIAEHPGKEEAAIEVDDADISEADGTFTVPISATQTASLDRGKWHEELFEIGDGVRNLLYSGTVLVRDALISQYEE